MPNNLDSHSPLTIDAWGQFPPPRVQATYLSSPRPTTPDIEHRIDAEWQRQTAAARASDRELSNGKMLRYVSHEVRGGEAPTLSLNVGPTTYREFVGTNLSTDPTMREIGRDHLANPVGTSAILITRDGRVCLGRRSDCVAYHAGHVHTFGGTLEPRDQADGGTIDPFASVCRELLEELSLSRAELIEPHCLGLVRDRRIRQPELLFGAHLAMTADDLRQRWAAAEARDEHDEIITLPDRPDAIAPFLAECGPVSPVAIGTLLLRGRARWGENWFRRASEAWAGTLGRLDP